LSISAPLPVSDISSRLGYEAELPHTATTVFTLLSLAETTERDIT